MTAVNGRQCRVYFAGERGAHERPSFVVTYHRPVGRAREVPVVHPPGCGMPNECHVTRARQLTVSDRLLARMLRPALPDAPRGG